MSDMMLFKIVQIFLFCAAGGLTAFIAYKKRRSVILWFILGGFFSVFAIVALGLFIDEK